MIPIPKYHASEPLHKFIKVRDEVLELRQFGIIAAVVWDSNAIPTMTEWKLQDWLATEKGTWVAEHGFRIHHVQSHNLATDELKLAVYAYISPKRWTEFCLKFGAGNE